jgi:hypothetical protein
MVPRVGIVDDSVARQHPQQGAALFGPFHPRDQVVQGLGHGFRLVQDGVEARRLLLGGTRLRGRACGGMSGGTCGGVSGCTYGGRKRSTWGLSVGKKMPNIWW